jgi:group I intron endonuclease
MKNFGYVYLTTNILNNKKYVGKKYGEFNPSYYGSGKLIKNSIKKYGIEYFKCEILKICKTETEINECEVFYIDSLSPEYNLACGGAGGNTIKFHDDDIKKNIIKKRAISLSENWKNKTKNEVIEWGKSISNSKKGKSNGKEGIKLSDETKHKISESNKIAAKNRSDSWKENHGKKMMEKRGLPNKKNWIPVEIDGIKYDGVGDAASKLNVVRQTINKWIKNGRGRYFEK